MDELWQSGIIARATFCSGKRVVESIQERKELDAWKISSSLTDAKGR